MTPDPWFCPVAKGLLLSYMSVEQIQGRDHRLLGFLWEAWSGSWRPRRRPPRAWPRWPRPARRTNLGGRPGRWGGRSSPCGWRCAPSGDGVSWLPGNTAHLGYRTELRDRRETETSRCQIVCWLAKLFRHPTSAIWIHCPIAGDKSFWYK